MAARNKAFDLPDATTKFQDATTYNNFYEFGVNKDDPVNLARTLKPRPWKMQVDGLAHKPTTFDVDDILKMAPQETSPDGITPEDAVVGQFLYTAAHEMGHAVFDLLDIPLFGRPEDAADEFAAHVLLRIGKEDARKLVEGAAYAYTNYEKNPTVTVSLRGVGQASVGTTSGTLSVDKGVFEITAGFPAISSRDTGGTRTVSSTATLPADLRAIRIPTSRR